MPNLFWDEKTAKRLPDLSTLDEQKSDIRSAVKNKHLKLLERYDLSFSRYAEKFSNDHKLSSYYIELSNYVKKAIPIAKDFIEIEEKINSLKNQQKKAGRIFSEEKKSYDEKLIKIKNDYLNQIELVKLNHKNQQKDFIEKEYPALETQSKKLNELTNEIVNNVNKRNELLHSKLDEI